MLLLDQAVGEAVQSVAKNVGLTPEVWTILGAATTAVCGFVAAAVRWAVNKHEATQKTAADRLEAVQVETKKERDAVVQEAKDERILFVDAMSKRDKEFLEAMREVEKGCHESNRLMTTEYRKHVQLLADRHTEDGKANRLETLNIIADSNDIKVRLAESLTALATVIDERIPTSTGRRRTDITLSDKPIEG
jgi:hypothetical protein